MRRGRAELLLLSLSLLLLLLSLGLFLDSDHVACAFGAREKANMLARSRALFPETACVVIGTGGALHVDVVGSDRVSRRGRCCAT